MDLSLITNLTIVRQISLAGGESALGEFESLAQQLEQMTKEGTMPEPKTESKQELPPYKVSPQDVASYKFDTSKLSKSRWFGPCRGDKSV